MRILPLRVVIAFILTIMAVSAMAAEVKVVGERRGGVNLAGDSLDQDSKAKKQILSLVESILKERTDALVMIEGDVATEKNPEVYVSKSLTLAKEVELLLHDSLKSPPDVILACRQLKPGPVRENSVKFSVMPASFKAERFGEKRSVKWVVVEKGESFEVTEYAEPLPGAGQVAEPLYIDPQLERRLVQQRQATQRAVAEQSRKADDLVARSKAKAAEKARKLERASRVLAPLPTEYR